MNIEDIKVSVIVPIYNVEKFVGKCIESIIHQTHKNLEIILVNDGSTDSSGSICDQYSQKDERIIIIHQSNKGVSITRNVGIDTATGEYICFIDGDDYVMKDYVEYLLNLVVEYKAEIGLTTETFGNFQHNQIKEDQIEVWNSEEATENILCYNVPIGCYCKIFKRDFIGTNIRFIPDIFIGEDFNFNVATFQRAKKIVSGKKRIYYYRRDNPTSAMTKFSIKKCENGLEALQIIKKDFIIDTERISKAWQYANWRTHSDFYDRIVLAKAQKEYPKMYKKCLTITKKEALIALKVPTSKQHKIRAIIMKIYPSLIPIAMKIRKVKYKVNI